LSWDSAHPPREPPGTRRQAAVASPARRRAAGTAPGHLAV